MHQLSLPKGKARRLNQFTIIKTLGEGKFGHVYLAENKDGRYALKKPTINFDAETILIDEAKILQKLDHPNIVKFIHFKKNSKYVDAYDQEQPCSVLILEYIQGLPLSDYIYSNRVFKPNIVRSIFNKLLDALDYLHTKQNIAHLDIKPQNIMIGDQFQVKVIDFGFSKDAEWPLSQRQGTPQYMAPEIQKIYNQNHYDGKAVDVFAAGVVLFMLYFSVPPFFKAVEDSHYKYFYNKQHLHHFWKIFQVEKGYFKFEDQKMVDHFKDLIQNMLAVDPKERYTTSKIKTHPWVLQKQADILQITKQLELRKTQYLKKLKQKSGNPQKLIQKQFFEMDMHDTFRTSSQSSRTQTFYENNIYDISLRDTSFMGNLDLILDNDWTQFVYFLQDLLLRKQKNLIVDEKQSQRYQIQVEESGEIRITLKYTFDWQNLMLMIICRLSRTEEGHLGIKFLKDEEGDLFKANRLINFIKEKLARHLV